MTMNRVQCYLGLSMTKFMDSYDSGLQVRGGADPIVLALGLCLPCVRVRADQIISFRCEGRTSIEKLIAFSRFQPR